MVIVKGAAATKLIENATAAPGVFVFAELLDSPNIQQVSVFHPSHVNCKSGASDAAGQLSTNSQQESYLNLLKIFSYGTYSDYKRTRLTMSTYHHSPQSYIENQSSLPPLNNAQVIKLKQLSIITFAADRRVSHKPGPFNEPIGY